MRRWNFSKLNPNKQSVIYHKFTRKFRKNFKFSLRTGINVLSHSKNSNQNVSISIENEKNDFIEIGHFRSDFFVPKKYEILKSHETAALLKHLAAVIK